MSLYGLANLGAGKSRSASPENVYGEKGRGGMAMVGDEPQEEVLRIEQKWSAHACARDLGQGWKVRVTIQALGWRSGGRYLPLQDDISSVAFWYQAEPHAPFPVLPGRDKLEVI